MNAMPLVLISAVLIVGWWLSSDFEFFGQDNDMAKQTGRIFFFKKQVAEMEKKITEERLDAMMTQAEELDDKTQMLLENMNNKKTE